MRPTVLLSVGDALNIWDGAESVVQAPESSGQVNFSAKTARKSAIPSIGSRRRSVPKRGGVRANRTHRLDRHVGQQPGEGPPAGRARRPGPHAHGQGHDHRRDQRGVERRGSNRIILAQVVTDTGLDTKHVEFSNTDERAVANIADCVAKWRSAGGVAIKSCRTDAAAATRIFRGGHGV